MPAPVRRASTAIAVVVSGTEVLLTTASAVRAADDTVTLSFDDGQTATATVAMTFKASPCWSPSARGTAAAMKLAGAPHDGDTVTLLGSTPTAVRLGVDADGDVQLQSWGTGDVVEGTPVVNGHGKVVAPVLQGQQRPEAGDDRPAHVAQRRRQRATSASTDPSTPGKPYLGVQLNADPKGSLTINVVDPNGPAAAAGVVAGDTVVADRRRLRWRRAPTRSICSPTTAPTTPSRSRCRPPTAGSAPSTLVLAVSPARA